MRSPIHTELAAGRWHTMTLAEQLANVGSEFHRTLKAFQNNQQNRFESAFDRLWELLNLTIVDPRWTGRRKQELTRLKEVIGEGFFGDSPIAKNFEALDAYFYYFGVNVRLAAPHSR